MWLKMRCLNPRCNKVVEMFLLVKGWTNHRARFRCPECGELVELEIY